jgi:hypothetical protein
MTALSSLPVIAKQIPGRASRHAPSVFVDAFMLINRAEGFSVTEVRLYLGTRLAPSRLQAAFPFAQLRQETTYEYFRRHHKKDISFLSSCHNRSHDQPRTLCAYAVYFHTGGGCGGHIDAATV